MTSSRKSTPSPPLVEPRAADQAEQRRSRRGGRSRARAERASTRPQVLQRWSCDASGDTSRASSSGAPARSSCVWPTMAEERVVRLGDAPLRVDEGEADQRRLAEPAEAALAAPERLLRAPAARSRRGRSPRAPTTWPAASRTGERARSTGAARPPLQTPVTSVSSTCWGAPRAPSRPQPHAHLGRVERGERHAGGLLRVVAVDALGARVPGGDHAVEADARRWRPATTRRWRRATARRSWARLRSVTSTKVMTDAVDDVVERAVRADAACVPAIALDAVHLARAGRERRQHLAHPADEIAVGEGGRDVGDGAADVALDDGEELRRRGGEPLDAQLARRGRAWRSGCWRRGW